MRSYIARAVVLSFSVLFVAIMNLNLAAAQNSFVDKQSREYSAHTLDDLGETSTTKARIAADEWKDFMNSQTTWLTHFAYHAGPWIIGESNHDSIVSSCRISSNHQEDIDKISNTCLEYDDTYDVINCIHREVTIYLDCHGDRNCVEPLGVDAVCRHYASVFKQVFDQVNSAVNLPGSPDPTVFVMPGHAMLKICLEGSDGKNYCYFLDHNDHPYETDLIPINDPAVNHPSLPDLAEPEVEEVDDTHYWDQDGQYEDYYPEALDRVRIYR